MEIKFANNYGFCMGVTRAVELINQLIQDNPEKKKRIVTLGPLIHNPFFLSQLKGRGVDTVSVDSNLETGTVAVVRTHGLPPSIVKNFKRQGVEIIDATCPRVRSSQKIISKYKERLVIVVGDQKHGEVVSLCGYAKKYKVVNSVEEAELIIEKKAILIAQTTISQAEFDAICEVLVRNIPDLIIKHTICKATSDRQQALKELIPTVDALLVIGGKASANTTRLFMIGSQSGKPTWHIEGSSEIPSEIYNYKVVGITAGASTPQQLIDEVVSVLRSVKI